MTRTLSLTRRDTPPGLVVDLDALDQDGRRNCLRLPDPDVMTPDVRPDASASHPAYRAAKAVCSGCPIQDACLRKALLSREQYGVWGGMAPAERDRMLAAGWGRSST